MSPAHPTTAAPAVPDLTSYRAVHRAIRQGAHRLAVATAEMVASDTARVRAVPVATFAATSAEAVAS
ncbi:MAG: hypothetical protein NTZ21_19115 [Actinobacteria bacterium]|nr:hypothetical protein [Actinomycetota bacterium]